MIAPSIAVVISIANSSARAAAMPSSTSRRLISSFQRAKTAGGPFDQGRRARGVVGIARFDRDGDDRATCAEVGLLKLLAIRGDKRVEDLDSSVPLRDSSGDVLARVIDCFAEQLGAAVRKVVVRRPARCAAVLEHVGDRGRLRPALADQQRRRAHHAFAWTRPSIYDGIHNMRARARGPRSKPKRLRPSRSFPSGRATVDDDHRHRGQRCGNKTGEHTDDRNRRRVHCGSHSRRRRE